MKLPLKILFLLLAFNITSGSLLAQQPAQVNLEDGYRLVNWNFEQGLIYGRINCILKDKDGFMWIGTQQALNRFDGSIFRNYLGLPKRNQQPIGNFISSLVEDSLHNIWIGTDKGMSRYNFKADTFAHFLPALTAASSSTFIVPFWPRAMRYFAGNPILF